MRALTSLFPILLLPLVLSGCLVGPAYQRPPVTLPEQLRGAPAELGSDSLADLAWWQIVSDETLQELIDEALRNNHDLRLAAWRIEEARATAGVTHAQLLPQLGASAGWSRGRSGPHRALASDTSSAHDVNLGLSWEIDLWGRIRRLDEAALARYLASEEAHRGVELSLVSEVASRYFELRALDLQLEIARRTSNNLEETAALFARRLEAGLSSGLETSSAEAFLAATLAVIPDLEQQIVVKENALAALLGRNPGEIRRGSTLLDQFLAPEIPPGLPSDLLKRRPDLRGAEQELVAANAEVGVAVADFFPSLGLTGLFGGVAPQVGDLFGDGKSWSVGGGLLSPLLQGKRLQNQHDAALARWQQARVRYEQAVILAFGEVSSALVAYQKLAAVEGEQTRAVDAYRDAVERSSSRYLTGLSDYLDVLEARQQLFPAENALARTRYLRLAKLVELYRGLGGGWQLVDLGRSTLDASSARVEQGS